VRTNFVFFELPRAELRGQFLDALAREGVLMIEYPHSRRIRAVTHYGIDAADKGAMRELAMRGGDYNEAERVNLLDYCQSDVDALEKLLKGLDRDELWFPTATERMAACTRKDHAKWAKYCRD